MVSRLSFAITVAAALLLIQTTASTQSSFRYSPSNAKTKAGTGGNTLPFGIFGTARYQQVHGDLKGNAVRVTNLTFRRGGITRDIPDMIARTVELDLTMANSDFAKSTTTFDNNLKATGKAVAIKRKKISLPNIAKFTGPLPAWNVDLKFDTPWLYLGKDDLAWDLKIYSTTSTKVYFLDFATYGQSSGVTNFGTSCTASGQTRPMLMQQFVTAYGGDKINIQWRIFYGPKSKTSPSVIFAAGRASQIPVPGLCTRLYVISPALILGGNATGTNGVFASPLFALAWDKNLVGVKLYAQGFTFDPTQKGLPWAGTHRVQSDYPAQPKILGPVRRIWASNTAAKVGSTDGFNPNAGLAVRMGHQ